MSTRRTPAAWPAFVQAGQRYLLSKPRPVFLRMEDMWRVTALTWLMMFLTPLVAQQPTVESALAKLGDEAVALDRSLPSFQCLQAASSEEVERGRHGQDGKVLRRVEFTANLRVRRGDDGKLAESAEFLTVDGRPYSANGLAMPAYARGGFLQPMSYFLPDQQHCYIYALHGNRIDFEAAHGAAKMADCRSAGTRGFALLDGAGEVTHIERRVGSEGVAAYGLIPFAAVELTPVALHGQSYQLSSALTSERPNGRLVDRFEARYTGCRLFTATVTIGPAAETPEP
jgi:hypothetical protein